MRKIYLLILGIIFLSFLVAFFFYPRVPLKMVSHWNQRGEPDGYISRFWGIFLLPFLNVFLFLLFIFIPKIDPLKKNIEKFRYYFDIFILFFLLFLFYLYLLTIAWNLGWRFDIRQVLAPAFFLLFFYCGILLEKSKRNWFIGIRTPWTLSNDKVWARTHKLGAFLFKLGGIFMLFGVFFPNIFWLTMIAFLIFVLLFPIIFSYFEFQKLSKK